MIRSLRFPVIVASLATATLSLAATAAEVSVTVKTDTVANTIHKHGYGHFFEHIYHSANNGLWGDVVWNRSFEQNRENAMGSPGWSYEGDILSYTGDEPQSRLSGGFEYRDLDYSVDVRKSPGDGAIRIFFRGNVSLTLGAENNTVHTLESRPRPQRGRPPGPAIPLASPVQGSLKPDQWYKVRVRVEGQHIQAWLDNEKIFEDR